MEKTEELDSKPWYRTYSLAIIAAIVFLAVLAILFGVLMHGSEMEENTAESKKELDLKEAPPVTIPRLDLGRCPDLYYTVYVVKQGDMVGHIAEKHHVSQDAIISVNKLRNTRSLQIGQLLKIPSMDGICYSWKKGETIEAIAQKYEINAEEIYAVNGLEHSTDDTTENSDHVDEKPALSEKELRLTKADYLFLPNAKLDWATLQEINGDLFKIPLHRRFYISSRYGWRRDPFNGRRSFHSGIDMAAPRGTPIYAALDGRVVAATYSRVFGNYVIIRHHSGYKSLYGHMNTITVRYGQWVNRKTRIGTVGTTGRSTGNHVHFSVYKNGKSINPATVWN